MESYLVYALLLALQLVGLDTIEDYSVDVIRDGLVTQTLDTRREGPILRFIENRETVLEVERSQLYGHVYTTYVSAQDQPLAFNMLSAALQIPTGTPSAYDIVVDDVFGTPSGPSEEGETPETREPMQGASEPLSNGGMVSWQVVNRGTTVYLTAGFTDLVIVLHQ